MRELGLTRDQIRQIRILNETRRPLMQNAQRRQRVAMRDLDQAIYADAVDETDVRLKLQELQLAQAEVAKIRAINELEVRKILTPEELVKFRLLRQRMIEFRGRGNDKVPNRRPPRDAPPNSPKRQQRPPL